MNRVIQWAALAALATGTAPGAMVWDFETFPAGWITNNQSVPVGTETWQQGNSGVFPAHAGSPDSFLASSYLAADALGGDLDNWLISPVIEITNGSVLSFFARANGALPDTLEVYLSISGASTDLADFNFQLFSISPVLDGVWTEYTTNFFGSTVQGRIGFRHVGDTAVDSDYVGIDTVTLTSPIPEPGSVILTAGGLLVVGFRRLRTVRARVWLAGLTVFAAAVMLAGSEGKEKKAEAKMPVPPAGTNLDFKLPGEPSKGMLAAVDPATGQLRPVEHDEAQALTGGGSSIASTPQVTTLPNGVVKATLGEAGMSFATAHIGPDGKVHLNCVHGSHAAAKAVAEGAKAEVTNEK